MPGEVKLSNTYHLPGLCRHDANNDREVLLKFKQDEFIVHYFSWLRKDNERMHYPGHTVIEAETAFEVKRDQYKKEVQDDRSHLDSQVYAEAHGALPWRLLTQPI